ncbi:MAG TPA: hypothetical protein V6C81_11395 [Planktothrix sp.]|jgi:hypothetical protein
MNDISTLPFVSNDLLLNELRRRVTAGWLPSDPAYVADLLEHLEGAQAEVASEVERQSMDIDWNSNVYQTAGTRRASSIPVSVEQTGKSEIYEWLRGHGYTPIAASSFINRLPSEG